MQDAVTSSFLTLPGLLKGPEDTSYIRPAGEPEAAWGLGQALAGLPQAGPGRAARGRQRRTEAVV